MLLSNTTLYYSQQSATCFGL